MKVIARKGHTLLRWLDWGDQTIFVGRSKENDIALSDADVSRRHAKLFVQEGIHLIEDLKSANGTKLNGKKIQRAEVREGDRIELGPFVISLEQEENTHPDLASSKTENETFNTTFAEASTDLKPDEHTLPPGSRSDDDFMQAIAVRPGMESKKSDPALKGLKHFLEDESSEKEASLPSLSEASQARLVRLDGKHAGEAIVMEEEISLAPSDRAPLPIQATIQKKEDSFIIKNEGENTGTFVDGVPVRERELENHDVIRVGRAEYEFVQGTSRSRAEVPRVVERTRSKPFASLSADWRILAVGGLVLGIGVTYLLSPSTSRKLPSQGIEQGDDETIRLTRFHLERAAKLISQKKYDEAEARIRKVLSDISPNQPDALQLLEEINAYRSDEKRHLAAEKAEEAERLRKIRNILAEGDRQKKLKAYDRARRIYEEALAIDGESRAALSALAALNEQEEKEQREAIARKKTNAELQRLYNEGVMKFESGDIGGAEVSLTEVASRKGHPYQASAQKLLDEIHRAADKKLDDRINHARSLMENDPLAAQSELKEIVTQFPKQERAAKLLTETKAKLSAKAKQSYTEGIAYLEVAEDTDSAMSKFKETLRYAPDPKNEYHQKAQRKLDELKRTQE